MCQALVEIMQPYIDEQVEFRVEKAEKNIAEREKNITEHEKNIAEHEKNIAEHEKNIMELTRVLIAAGRMDDLNKAIDNAEYRNRLCEEFALA